MRPGIIIAIVAAVAVVIGGVLWYNSSNQAEQARLEEQRTMQAAQDAREEERAAEEQVAREEEAERARDEQVTREAEAEATDQAARETQGAGALPAEDAAVEDASVTDGDRTVVGDEITEGAIVVQSTTDEAITFEPDDNLTTAENIGDAETVDSATTTEPEQFLTPENFDRDEVLTLINDSEQLTGDQRSTLSALVEGASANPEMVDGAIESVRSALDLAPLN